MTITLPQNRYLLFLQAKMTIDKTRDYQKTQLTWMPKTLTPVKNSQTSVLLHNDKKTMYGCICLLVIYKDLFFFLSVMEYSPFYNSFCGLTFQRGLAGPQVMCGIDFLHTDMSSVPACSVSSGVISIPRTFIMCHVKAGNLSYIISLRRPSNMSPSLELSHAQLVFLFSFS